MRYKGHDVDRKTWMRYHEQHILLALCAVAWVAVMIVGLVSL